MSRDPSRSSSPATPTLRSDASGRRQIHLHGSPRATGSHRRLLTARANERNPARRGACGLVATNRESSYLPAGRGRRSGRSRLVIRGRGRRVGNGRSLLLRETKVDLGTGRASFVGSSEKSLAGSSGLGGDGDRRDLRLAVGAANGMDRRASGAEKTLGRLLDRVVGLRSGEAEANASVGSSSRRLDSRALDCERRQSFSPYELRRGRRSISTDGSREGLRSSSKSAEPIVAEPHIFGSLERRDEAGTASCSGKLAR